MEQALQSEVTSLLSPAYLIIVKTIIL